MSDPAGILRAHGLNVTAQRLAVLRAVAQCPHGSAESIAQAVRDEIGAISRQAVYDVLGVLTEVGLVRRIQPAGSPALFDPRVGDAHQHAICRACGAVADVDAAVGSVPCLAAALDSGYEIEEAEVVYWGRCPSCRTRAPESAAAERRRARTMESNASPSRNRTNQPQPPHREVPRVPSFEREPVLRGERGESSTRDARTSRSELRLPASPHVGDERVRRDEPQ